MAKISLSSTQLIKSNICYTLFSLSLCVFHIVKLILIKDAVANQQAQYLHFAILNRSNRRDIYLGNEDEPQ